MPKIICLRQTWSHMASVSGFDGFAAALENNPRVKFDSLWSYSSSLTSSRYVRRFLQRIRLLNSDSQLLAFKLIKQLKLKDDSFALLMASEEQLLPILPHVSENMRCRLIVTAHQPPAWYRLNWNDFSTLEGLGGIVCLSNDQVNFFKKITSTRTILIKHGVNNDFFKPLEQLNSRSINKLLFVGQWLRDFVLLERCMQIIWESKPDTILNCVIPTFSRSNPALYRLARDERVNWFSNIDAHELKNLYQNSTLLFLPLLDSTANNAIVEALASGLPVVCTDVGGAKDYLPAGAGQLCEIDNAVDHSEAVLTLLNHAELRSKAATCGRSFALNELVWEKIATSFLEQIECQ